ncbi:Uncharacterised protein [Klebsiella variicola]|nr:Uncharacterised protein [Klebsiella variicola]
MGNGQLIIPHSARHHQTGCRAILIADQRTGVFERPVQRLRNGEGCHATSRCHRLHQTGNRVVPRNIIREHDAIACVVAQRIQLGGGLVCNPLLKILHQATHAGLVGVILIEYPIELVVLDFHRCGIVGCPAFNSLLCPGDAVDVRHVYAIKIIVGRHGKSALQLLHHLMRRYDPRPGLNPLAVDRRKAIA